jgi:hypothetical protein
VSGEAPAPLTDGGILAALGQIQQELGRQSTQLAVITTKLDAVTNNSADHETRIRALETSKSKIMGGASAVGLLSGGLATLIYWVLQAHH